MASSLAWQQLPTTFSSFQSSSSSSSSSSFSLKRSSLTPLSSPLRPSLTQSLREMRGKAVAEGRLEAKAEPAIAVKFEDPRWKNGTWDLLQFKKDGEMDWNAVIDAEVYRRKWLEDNPESSNNDEPVLFETSTIPWWAWVKRFHLPEAELLNGRAAMVGFFMSYFVDALTGVGLVDQMDNFFGKLLLFVSVVGVLVVRKNEDVKNIQNLAKEWTFYDRQWQATWQDAPLPGSEKEK